MRQRRHAACSCACAVQHRWEYCSQTVERASPSDSRASKCAEAVHGRTSTASGPRGVCAGMAHRRLNMQTCPAARAPRARAPRAWLRALARSTRETAAAAASAPRPAPGARRRAECRASKHAASAPAPTPRGISRGPVPHDNHVRRAPARVRHPSGAIPQRRARVRRHPAQYRLHLHPAPGGGDATTRSSE